MRELTWVVVGSGQVGNPPGIRPGTVRLFDWVSGSADLLCAGRQPVCLILEIIGWVSSELWRNSFDRWVGSKENGAAEHPEPGR